MLCPNYNIGVRSMCILQVFAWSIAINAQSFGTSSPTVSPSSKPEKTKTPKITNPPIALPTILITSAPTVSSSTHQPTNPSVSPISPSTIPPSTPSALPTSLSPSATPSSMVSSSSPSTSIFLPLPPSVPSPTSPPSFGIDDEETIKTTNISIIVGVVLLVVLVFIVFLWHRRRPRRENITTKSGENGRQLSNPVYDDTQTFVPHSTRVGAETFALSPPASHQHFNRMIVDEEGYVAETVWGDTTVYDIPLDVTA
eukprot:m.138185 g.138185  ORF g.138185 m.138185 type:complete len:255 (+) comp29976_c0_seq1:544-1308(+)